ncbi:hypothetical protein Q4508_07625 [Amphritea sp. 2_MG-2023]|uniref:hypothetical protein n=1 Tax=Amphritea TaxID=515417 RepID=UPI001C070773|nr:MULTISPECIES: hypothetical protein [Amphritea]MBU2964023.1 hypothetical protein [Amphritea atlantica]MDO6418423.1 hypothetical protein [Amphritea sp. 2_MG-2023]
MKKVVFIEDHVVPQLFTSALEAYSFEHKVSKGGKSYKNLETFGLLWGYVIPEKLDSPAKVIATMCTVETSATRHKEWVSPNFESLAAKKKFFQSYWPNIELVGTFHSHPYASFSEVKELKGWRASDADEQFFPYIHEVIAPEQDALAHLIVTVTELQKRGWAYPDRLSGSERNKGFALTADDYKIWIRGYTSDRILDEESEDFSYSFADDSDLDIPSLQNRFI